MYSVLKGKRWNQKVIKDKDEVNYSDVRFNVSLILMTSKSPLNHD